MKKLLAIIMVTTMIICLSACGKSEEAPEEQATEAPVAESVETEEPTEEPAAEEADNEEPTDKQEEETPAKDEKKDKTEKEDVDIDVAEAEAAAEGDFPILFINSEPFVISGSEGFDNAGFTTYINDTTATYSFTSSSEDVTWSIYVLDEVFEAAPRYIVQAYDPALEGDGTLEIEAGKYIYIQCSVNGFTADEPTEETLSIDYAE